MDLFSTNNARLLELLESWEPRLLTLPEETITMHRNTQHRNIKQIVGHMIDSASNNTHRIIHLQYNANPLIYPDYANLGKNDIWIAIQNYQDENWYDLVKLWKYSNRHIVHVIKNVIPEKLGNIWISSLKEEVTLHDMISDYLRHFELHIAEIQELLDQK
jgi:hypothetical protein